MVCQPVLADVLRPAGHFIVGLDGRKPCAVTQDVFERGVASATRAAVACLRRRPRAQPRGKRAKRLASRVGEDDVEVGEPHRWNPGHFLAGLQTRERHRGVTIRMFGQRSSAGSQREGSLDQRLIARL